MAQRWKPAEDRVLCELYPQDVPIREISLLLGRSEDAVCERRRTLGLPARPRQRPWSPAEDALLRAATAAGVPAAELARRLGRDPEQIRRRRRGLLGARPSPRPYAPAEDEMIRACWAGERDVAQLARELGRSPGSIRLRAQKLGAYEPPRRQRWSGFEDAEVRDGYELGLTCAQIAAQLDGRTAAAVAARAAKLGMATYARKWTPREDRVLRALADQGVGLERAAQLLARTPDALRARARKLALPPLRSRHGERPARRWTSAEDDLLVLHAGLNPGVLAELLVRSPEGVTQRLRSLGLREARQRSPHHPAPASDGFTAGERITVARELRTGGPRRQLALARRLGRRPADVRMVASA